MQKGIHDYDTFCLAYDAKNVQVQFMPEQTLEKAERAGWKLRWWRTRKDFLLTCRLRPENFSMAYDEFAADFYFQRDQQ